MDGNKSSVVPAPQPLLTVPDGVLLIVGMVVGAGIFKAPSIVAGNVGSGWEFALLWIAGGIASLCGALVYAELSGRFPETGGEYRFLERAYGGGASFVFAWARMTVVQTGAIAAVSFVFGDYAQQILPLGARGGAIYAALAVAALTAVNLVGTPHSKGLQKVLSATLFIALAAVALAGILGPGAPAAAASARPAGADLGLAMIFVLLTYGGWNEAAYIAGEVHEPRRNMVRILVGGILAVTALYLVVNLGYYSALGLQGMRDSKAVAADVVRQVAGGGGAVLIALLVCVSSLTTMNAAIITGARTNYAFGRDVPMLGFLGSWRAAGSTPANALLLQGALTLVLVFAGSFTPDGFSSMVAYTTPVFWTFFLLCGIALFVFRARAGRPEAFRVPLFPLVPLVFCATCAYMLYSSVNYVRFAVSFGNAVLAGIAVMAIGIPLYFLARRR
ncbi:MAG: amino acid permease [Betaproteobacteria bacterium]|nr:amino acid permease [Betaproteobacteria bacterium]MDH5221174.1 amino acid permease [Betaproteobacteria bacterium]MDH5351583.1 amino acid permease [Betaproteobacteria bacterium]